MKNQKTYLLKLIKEWSKEAKIWNNNLRHTELFIGFIFLDVIVILILNVIVLLIFRNEFLRAISIIILVGGYTFSYYNFYNWANNGLKAHLLFKKLQKEAEK